MKVLVGLVDTGLRNAEAMRAVIVLVGGMAAKNGLGKFTRVP